MNKQLYYLIKDKHKFNKIRFKYFQCLIREIVDGNEFFYDIDGKITMENSSTLRHLVIRDELWLKIFTKSGSKYILTNDLCGCMVFEIFKITPFPSIHQPPNIR